MAVSAMAMIKSFRDLDAWRVAMDLAVNIYKFVDRLPRCERFEMASQMRRAAVSVPSNIAEGEGHGATLRNRNHVRIAAGSVAELSTCVEICLRVGYVDSQTASTLQDELTRTRKLVHGLQNSILRRVAAEGAKAGAIILACWYLFA